MFYDRTLAEILLPWMIAAATALATFVGIRRFGVEVPWIPIIWGYCLMVVAVVYDWFLSALEDADRLPKYGSVAEQLLDFSHIVVWLGGQLALLLAIGATAGKLLALV